MLIHEHADPDGAPASKTGSAAGWPDAHLHMPPQALRSISTASSSSTTPTHLDGRVSVDSPGVRAVVVPVPPLRADHHPPHAALPPGTCDADGQDVGPTSTTAPMDAASASCRVDDGAAGGQQQDDAPPPHLHADLHAKRPLHLLKQASSMSSGGDSSHEGTPSHDSAAAAMHAPAALHPSSSLSRSPQLLPPLVKSAQPMQQQLSRHDLMAIKERQREARQR